MTSEEDSDKEATQDQQGLPESCSTDQQLSVGVGLTGSQKTYKTSSQLMDT